MSPDETIVLFVTAGFGIQGWYRWYKRLGRLSGFRMPPYLKPVLALLPLGALGCLFCVLRRFASADVRSDAFYLAYYAVFGAAWLVWILELSERVLGVSPALDAMERRNPAAILMTAGILLGGAACFSGGNIGDGPGWWCVAFASGLATAFWMGLWAVLERVAHVSDAVTVERDAWAGLRMGAFLLATGLICGNAAAGDWFGFLPTVVDFAKDAWPALILAAVALPLEWLRSRRPLTDGNPWAAVSVILSVAYVAAAAFAVYRLAASMENPLYGLPPLEKP